MKTIALLLLIFLSHSAFAENPKCDGSIVYQGSKEASGASKDSICISTIGESSPSVVWVDKGTGGKILATGKAAENLNLDEHKPVKLPALQKGVRVLKLTSDSGIFAGSITKIFPGIYWAGARSLAQLTRADVVASLMSQGEEVSERLEFAQYYDEQALLDLVIVVDRNKVSSFEAYLLLIQRLYLDASPDNHYFSYYYAQPDGVVTRTGRIGEIMVANGGANLYLATYDENSSIASNSGTVVFFNEDTASNIGGLTQCMTKDNDLRALSAKTIIRAEIKDTTLEEIKNNLSKIEIPADCL